MNHDATSSDNHEPRPDRIRSAFAEMPLPPVPSPDETFARVMAAADSPPVGNVPAVSSTGPRPSALRIVMRIASPLAAAAAIAIVLFVSLRPGGVSTAFAQVQERLAEVQTAEYQMTVTSPGKEPIITRVQLKEGLGTRQTFFGTSGDIVTITSATQQSILTLTDLGQAIRIEMPDAPSPESLNPVEELRRVGAWSTEPAEREVVSGRRRCATALSRERPTERRGWMSRRICRCGHASCSPIRRGRCRPWR